MYFGLHGKATGCCLLHPELEASGWAVSVSVPGNRCCLCFCAGPEKLTDGVVLCPAGTVLGSWRWLRGRGDICCMYCSAWRRLENRWHCSGKGKLLTSGRVLYRHFSWVPTEGLAGIIACLVIAFLAGQREEQLTLLDDDCFWSGGECHSSRKGLAQSDDGGLACSFPLLFAETALQNDMMFSSRNLIVCNSILASTQMVCVCVWSLTETHAHNLCCALCLLNCNKSLLVRIAPGEQVSDDAMSF